MRSSRHTMRRLRLVGATLRARYGADPDPAGTTGVVEMFEPTQAVGWVSGQASDFPARVTLHVNDIEVASTWADDQVQLNASDEVRGFRIPLCSVWTYCGTADRITICTGAKALPIVGHGTYAHPDKDGQFPLSALARRFDEGYLFNRNGYLQLSKKLNTAWQGRVTDMYRRVNDVILQEHGHELFVMYGTLLGVVRDHGFVGHDNDFDTAYLSGHTDGPAAAAELRDIALTLIDAGFDVECRRTALHVHDPVDPRARIDVFHVYFDRFDNLAFPFGAAGTGEIIRRTWTGLHSVQLGGTEVRVPPQPAAFVERLYGPSWRTPIIGFNWDRARTGWAKEGRIPARYTEEVYWANFYARHELTTASAFAEFVLGRTDLPRAVLDIGCGDGRDSFAFARAGRRTCGLDRSTIGIRHAATTADRAGLAATLNFATVDVCDANAVSEIVKQTREAAGGGPLLYYLRFFLNSIPAAAENTLMNALAAAAHDGDAFAAEFRAEKDEANPKVYGGHYRRYQDGFAFGRALNERYGFEVVHEEEGTGLAPYRDEDPVVYRVIAHRRATMTSESGT